VENQHFRTLLKYLDPAVYSFLISRQTQGRDILRLFKAKRNDVKELLVKYIASGGKTSLTLDCCSSISQQGYLTVSSHFAQRLACQDHSRLNHILLAFKPIGIEDYVRAITSDNASLNNDTFNGLEESGRIKGFRVADCAVSCMGQVLNLSAQQVLEAIDCHQDPIDENDLSNDSPMEHLEEPEDHEDMNGDSDAAVGMIFQIACCIVAKIRTSNILFKALAI